MNTKIYEEIAERRVITERQIGTMKRRANEGFIHDVASIFALGALQITSAQTQKGLDWLKNLWKTPMGRERKHNPFHQREQSIIRHFDRFELVTFNDHGSMFTHNYLPVYRVYDTRGYFFDYVAKYNNKYQPITIYKR